MIYLKSRMNIVLLNTEQMTGNDSRPKRSQVQNFVEFNVDGNKLTGITYEIDQNINNGEPFVIDTFGIIKDEDNKNDQP